MKLLLALSFAFCHTASAFIPADQAQTNAFYRVCSQFESALKSPEIRMSSRYWEFALSWDPSERGTNRLGVSILPLLCRESSRPGIPKERKLAFYFLWMKLTRRALDAETRLWTDGSYSALWNGGRELAAERVSFLLSEMRSAEKEKRENDRRRAARTIAAQGIFAYETLFSELEKGNDDTIPVFDIMNWDGNAPKMEKNALLRWWNENRDQYTLPSRSEDSHAKPNLDQWVRSGR